MPVLLQGNALATSWKYLLQSLVTSFLMFAVT